MENRKYHGKVILFGEYSMIFDSDALLIPYYPARGEWSSIMNRPSGNGIESNKNLFRFYDYLCADDRFRILDLRRFEMELNAGLYFDSNIPNGYGVGSSGALVAAIYDRYKLTDIEDISMLKDFLASMENFFHGSSSGIDPLQCFHGKPFVLSQLSTGNRRQTSLTTLDHDFISENIHIFLIDTKIKSHTAPLVERFKELRKNEQYLYRFDNEYVPLVGKCIESLVKKEDRNFFESMSRLSRLQTELLSHAIPDEMKLFFFADADEDGFIMKLCGSGGGGFLLGFSSNIDKTNQYWRNVDKKIIWIR